MLNTRDENRFQKLEKSSKILFDLIRLSKSNNISLKKNSMLLNLNCKSKPRLKASNYFFSN